LIAREQFLAAVRSCIGTPVGHRGRTIGKALDCVGVPWAACVACGMEMVETPAYRRLAIFCDEVADPAAAHLLQVYVREVPRHVVVPVGVSECGQMIVVHAWHKNRIVQDAILADRVAAHWRIRGVA
jgi:hypothetical protein